MRLTAAGCLAVWMAARVGAGVWAAEAQPAAEARPAGAGQAGPAAAGAVAVPAGGAAQAPAGAVPSGSVAQAPPDVKAVVAGAPVAVGRPPVVKLSRAEAMRVLIRADLLLDADNYLGRDRDLPYADGGGTAGDADFGSDGDSGGDSDCPS